MSEPTDLITIDLMHTGQPWVVASYLLLGEEPALVDPGPARTLPQLEAGLAANGLGVGDLRHILLTHIHLDHAGATGSLLARNPQLQVYIHERGAPHMVNPERLLSSALRLYGDRMDELWGEMLALDPAAVTTLRGGELLHISGRTLRVYDAPGHAKHHLIYADQGSSVAFVGDNCGVRLPGHLYARPATPPPDVDIEQWEATLTLLSELGPGYLALTHFGIFDDPQEHIAAYRERLRGWADLVRAGLASGATEAEQIAALRMLAEAEVGGSAEMRDLYQRGGPSEQSWQGLARYWRKRGIGNRE